MAKIPKLPQERSIKLCVTVSPHEKKYILDNNLSASRLLQERINQKKEGQEAFSLRKQQEFIELKKAIISQEQALKRYQDYAARVQSILIAQIGEEEFNKRLREEP